MSAEDHLREAAIQNLADSYAANVRREAARSWRNLAPRLCAEYDALTSDAERRAFYLKHENSLAGVTGLVSICLMAGKKLSPRARQELAATPERPAAMARSVFDALRPEDQMRFIKVGGRIRD